METIQRKVIRLKMIKLFDAIPILQEITYYDSKELQQDFQSNISDHIYVDFIFKLQNISRA